MITAISSTERGKFAAMYRSALRKIAPTGVFYGVVMAIGFPLLYIIQRAVTLGAGREAFVNAYGFSGLHNAVTILCLAILCAAVPILVGVMMYSFLHNKRAADVYHALPIRRELLFGAHYLAGLTVLWLPLVVCYLVVLATAGLFGADAWYPFLPGPILQELLCWLVQTAAIYTITCLVAVLVGTSFDTALFSLALCGMWPVLALILEGLLETLLLGFVGFGYRGAFSLVSKASMSPFTTVLYRLVMQPAARPAGEQAKIDYAFTAHQAGLWAWAGIALAALVLAVAVYRRRPSERAGRPVVTSLLSRLVQFATAFAAGGLCGILFAASFNSRGLSILFTALGGSLAFALLEVVFGRGFKTFPRAFLPLGAAAAVPLLALGIVFMGGFGFVDRIPAADEVESVEINYTGRFGWRYRRAGSTEEGRKRDMAFSSPVENVTITDPAGIEAIRQLHRASIDDLRGHLMSYENEADSYALFSPRLCYRLRDGRTLERSYGNLEAKSIEALTVIENLEEFKQQTHPAFLFTEETLMGVGISNRLGIETHEQMLTQPQKTRILEALRADVRTETVERLRGDGGVARGYLRLVESGLEPADTVLLPGMSTILLTDDFTNTLSALRELGLEKYLELDESRVTMAAFGNKRFCGSRYGDQGSLYDYFVPENQMYVNWEADPNQHFDDWDLVDPALIPGLLASARNAGAYQPDGWLVQFRVGGAEGAMPLLVPEELLPQELRERYLKRMEEAYGYQGDRIAAETKTVPAVAEAVIG